MRRNNRSTFISQATYVDGEYVYPGSDYPRGSGSKLSKLSLSSFQSSTSTGESGDVKKTWRYKGPMASVGNWSK
jgi:hypothetical protein